MLCVLMVAMMNCVISCLKQNDSNSSRAGHANLNCELLFEAAPIMTKKMRITSMRGSVKSGHARTHLLDFAYAVSRAFHNVLATSSPHQLQNATPSSISLDFSIF